MSSSIVAIPVVRYPQSDIIYPRLAFLAGGLGGRPTSGVFAPQRFARNR
jgi:hypothetical protein